MAFDRVHTFAGIPPETGGRMQRFLARAAAKAGMQTTISPGALATGEPELERAMRVANAMYQKGLVRRMRSYDFYSDEPKLYGFGMTEGVGINFFSKEKALWAVIGEGLERSIWKNTSDFFSHPRTMTFREARALGRALNPSTVAGYTEEQRAQYPGFSFSEHTEFMWVHGWSHTSQEPIWIPAQLVSGKWGNDATASKKEPMLRLPITTGLATHTTYEKALLKGLLETIERDAFMITWLNKITAPRVDLEELSSRHPSLQKILASFSRYNIEAYAIRLVTDFPIPIIGGVLIDRSGVGPAVCVGARASYSLAEAVEVAFTEAMGLRLANRRRMHETEYREKMSKRDRLIWWSQEEQLPLIDFFIAGESIKVSEEDHQAELLAAQPDKVQLAHAIGLMKERDYEAAFVDLTRSSLNPTNLKVTYTVVPQLQPLFLHEDFPCRGGRRLETVPRAYGYTPIKNLLSIPHPFP
jgi:ribosomal protein S12 methylthiotransferase accessory factor